MTAVPGTVTVRVLTFDTEDGLREHALRLNEKGIHPNVSIMDARGIAVLASVAGCYADEFFYYAPCENGYMHCSNGECCEDCANHTWRPTFPVSALAVSSRRPDPCPRCESTNTWLSPWEDRMDLVCRDCGYGT